MAVLQNKVWQICLVIFLLHQLSQKLFKWSYPWIDAYLDNLLCLPIFMGFLLMERRFLWQKKATYCFPLLDVILLTLILSFIYEELFPVFFQGFTKDYWDYLFYGLGAMIFYKYINI